MAYTKSYARVMWENEPSTASPLNETNLNKMDYMIDVLDTRTVELSSNVDNLNGYEARVAEDALSADNSAESAETYMKLTKSYAIGTNGEVRPGDTTDNAKYYYEKTKTIAQSLPQSEHLTYNTQAEANDSTYLMSEDQLIVVLQN